MKSIDLLALALVFTGCATGPKMATEEGKVSYIDEVKGTKSELYTRASVKNPFSPKSSEQTFCSKLLI